MSFSLCPNDARFGPGSDCRTLDFTIAFESWILSLAPDVLFAIVAVARIARIVRHSRKLSKFGVSLPVKFLSMSLLVAANAVRLAELRTFGELASIVGGLSSVSMALATSVLFTILSPLEHCMAIEPSTLILTYTLCKAILNGAILRTYTAVGVLEDDRALYVSTCICTAAFVCVFLSELVEKRSLLLPQYKDANGEATSSSVSRMTFRWLLPLLIKGRTTRLTLADLKDIPKSFTAGPARDALQAALSSGEKTTLFSATVKAFGLTMLAPVIPRLLLLLLTFAQPLLVDDLITFVSSDESMSRGWALVGGFVAVYGLMFLVTCMYWEKVYHNVVHYRAALVGTVYLKSLRLSSHVSKSVGTGAASTYMSVDVERVCDCFELLHELWAAALSVVLAEAGWPGFLPIPVTVAVLGICAVTGISVAKRQAKWMSAVDKRVKLMSSIVSQFLPVKWFNYEEAFNQKIAHLRNEELQQYRYFLDMIAVTVALANNASILCTLSVLGVYAGTLGRGALGPSRLFTIATTVGLLNGPLNTLGQNIPEVLAGYSSLLRLAKFLSLEERKDNAVTGSLVSAPVREFTLGMEKASFSWDTDGEPYLCNVDLSVQAGDVKVFIGKVGSGKSMLLKSIIGETVRRGGAYQRPNFDIAYAGQEAFITPGTIRENILFGRPYDGERYDRIVQACALLPDFARMPKRDETYLQEAGGSVSGGQRQRIGLARAIYAGCAVTLLDCPFSALDARTEDHVFNSLLGTNGLLKGKTVLLATHNVQHTSVGTEIIVLETGLITHRGSIHDIRAQGFDLTEYLGNDLGEDPEQQITAPKGDAQKIDQTDADNEASLDITGRGLTTMFFYIRSTGTVRVALYAFSVIFMCGVQLGSKGILQQWSESPASQWRVWVGGFGAFSVMALVSSSLCFAWFIYITRATALNMHARELSGLFGTMPSYFMSTPSGVIINRFSADIMQLDMKFPVAMLNIAAQGLTIVGTLIIVVIPTPYLALSFLVLGPAYYGLVQFYLTTSTQLQKLEAASKSPLYTMFSTTISGLDTIRTFGAQAYFQAQNDKHLNASQGPFHYRFAGMRLLRAGLTLITFVLAVGLACLAVGLRSSKSASLLGLSLSNLTSMTSMLSNFLMSYAEFENSAVSINRIRQIAELPPEEKASSVDAPPSSSPYGSKPNEWPSRGAIVFRDVSFRYKEDLPDVLSRLFFSVKPGIKIGICGRTGSGKSSILLALLRGVEDSLVSGTICIDGVDISQLSPSVVRRSLSLVTQEPFLWFSSARDNLDLEHVCTDSEIWDALELVGMKDLVSALPEKLDTVLEAGGSFSRGERQLLCLARVLLRKRQIVLLDEATSSMDEASQAKIIDVVRAELKEKTVVAIAHRLSTIVNFDLVILLGDGKILESGNPQALLSDQNSSFYALAASQGVVGTSS